MFDEALRIVKTKHIVYTPDATMQAMLSDAQGRVLIVEPGIGYHEKNKRYSLITNYSLLNPDSTRPYIVLGNDRYERAISLLNQCGSNFTVSDAFSILRTVQQEGVWASRVSFVYSSKKRTVFYVENNHFEQVLTYKFD